MVAPPLERKPPSLNLAEGATTYNEFELMWLIWLLLVCLPLLAMSYHVFWRIVQWRRPIVSILMIGFSAVVFMHCACFTTDSSAVVSTHCASLFTDSPAAVSHLLWLFYHDGDDGDDDDDDDDDGHL